MDEVLRATTFKHSNRSFLAALDEHGIQYSAKAGSVGKIMELGINIEIIITGGWGAIAVACMAWAHVRKSRRINITTKDNQSVWLEGYSAKEAEKILHSAKQISVIDTKPDKK